MWSTFVPALVLGETANCMRLCCTRCAAEPSHFGAALLHFGPELLWEYSFRLRTRNVRSLEAERCDYAIHELRTNCSALQPAALIVIRVVRVSRGHLLHTAVLDQSEARQLPHTPGCLQTRVQARGWVVDPQHVRAAHTSHSPCGAGARSAHLGGEYTTPARASSI